ncbi:hypothetical protein EI94DRAFT_1819519 [Lactarius quietus]|nr:hypothetical protein EI94DRAFT_1819519 [Lactarius quietus]
MDTRNTILEEAAGELYALRPPNTVFDKKEVKKLGPGFITTTIGPINHSNIMELTQEISRGTPGSQAFLGALQDATTRLWKELPAEEQSGIANLQRSGPKTDLRRPYRLSAAYRHRMVQDFQTQLFKTCGMWSVVLVAYADEFGNVLRAYLNGKPDIPSVTLADGYQTKMIQTALQHYCMAHICVCVSQSDIVSPSDNVKTRRCMHEHWKDCQDYPEAHKWVGKDPEYDEEEQHWKQIKDDFILEEKFTKWNLRRLRRSLELWQEAVEEEVRQKIAAEAVLKLSSDGPHTPSRNSPTPDEEAETLGDGKEDPDEEETITADDVDMYPPWILHPKENRRPRRDNNTSKEEEVPDEAEEYVEDVKSPAVAEKEEEKAEEDDGYDEAWMGPRGEYTPFDPKFLNSKYFREMPTEPSEGSNPWQQQVEAAKQSLAQYHQTAAPVPAAVLPVPAIWDRHAQDFSNTQVFMDTSAGRGRARVASSGKEVGPFVDLRVCFHCGREDTFAPFVPVGSSRAVVRVRSHAKKSRRVRFNAQEKVKTFKRGSPPSDVRSQFLSPHSDAGHLSRTVLVERLHGRSPEREVMSQSDIVSPSDNVKTRRCMHEHWKDCQDYPEAHKWVGKDPEYDEEEQVRALVWSQGTDEEDYIGEGEALRIAQLVSGMLVHAEPSSAGTSIAGRMKIT